jgi:predicted nucleic acid-binding protein
VKWAIPPAQETLARESVQLLKRYRDGEISFIVPDVFWAEVGNAWWKGVRQQRWPKAVAEPAVSEMRSRSFFTVSSQDLLPEALKIAFATTAPFTTASMSPSPFSSRLR